MLPIRQGNTISSQTTDEKTNEVLSNHVFDIREKYILFMYHKTKVYYIMMFYVEILVRLRGL